MHSVVVTVASWYSMSFDDRAIVDCFLLIHETQVEPSEKNNQVVDLLVFTSLAQWKFE